MSKKVNRLFEAFQPSAYQVELNPDRTTLKLEGTVVVTGQKTGRPSHRFTFNQRGLTIEQAEITKLDKKEERSIDIVRINHHARYDEVRLHTRELLYPGTYRITMRFTGAVQTTMHGIYISNYKVGDQEKALVSSQFESHYAREGFPCIDEPEAKATFDLTLLSPTGEAAISNMPTKSQKQEGDKQVTVFETTPKMSTYLLAFVYGDLQCKQTKTDSGVVVRAWATKAQPLESLDFALEIGKRSIEFFNEFYGIPYPLPKCDHVTIPNFSVSAMENWGLITYREVALLIDPATASQSSREMVAICICHEISHQWFGNLVTMRWWNDLWLNESFANVMEYVSTDTLFPEWQMWNSFIGLEGLSSLRRDATAGVQSVDQAVNSPEEITALFDPSIVYAKGGRLINMLMRYIGQDAFRKGLKAYFIKYAYGNTSGSDLWAKLSEASGKNVASFMNPWLQRSGFPRIDVDQQGNKLTVTQHHFLLDPAKADQERLWPVPLLASSTQVPQLLDTRELTVTLSDNDFVRFDQGAVGHYIVHYANPEHLKAIAKLAEAKQLSIGERLMLLSDSSLLARSGSQSFADTLRLLEYYTHEDAEPVWDIIALVISDCRRFIDVEPKLEAKLKALVRKLIEAQFKRLGWEDKDKESSQDVKLRAIIIGLGVYAEHTNIVAHAIKLFEEYKTNPQAIAPELTGIVFSAAIRNNVKGAFEYLLKLDSETSNVDLKQDIVAGLTSERHDSKIKLLLGRMQDEKQVRLQDMIHWLAGLLMNRYSRQLAWDWMRDNWSWLEVGLKGDVLYDYLPRYAASVSNTSQLLNEYKTFFEPLKKQLELRRNIEIGIEEISNRLVWLSRDLAAVKEYFK